jgi:hypothetical protein
MKHTRRALQVCLAAGVCVHTALAQPATTSDPSATAGATRSTDARPELSDALPQGRPIGTGRLTVWGFQVYDARLWAQPGFSAGNYDRAPLALELSYLRAFTSKEVAGRSIKEMRRSQPVSDTQAARWSADLLRVIPDIRKGDRVMGVHQPGVGATFWVNGKISGEVQDAEFARLFFGIWLSPNTSEPKLRDALLAGAAE